MRDTMKWRVTMAGAGAIVVLLATSVFADETPRARGLSNGRQTEAAKVQAATRNDLRPSGQSDRNGSYDRNGNQQNGSYGRNDNAVRQTNQTRQDRNVTPVRQTNQARQDRNVVTESSRSGNGNRNSSQANRGSYRENERVTLSGNVTSYTREGNGYRVQLDRDRNPFWIPASRLSSFGHDLRVGVSISLGGIFRGGRIEVDAMNYPGNYGYDQGYDQGYLRGVVDRVDYRSGILTLRDDASGRIVDVDMRPTARTSRIDLNDVRRGDYIALSGEWTPGGLFSAYRIDSVDTGRY
jgi:hypothetical protein